MAYITVRKVLNLLDFGRSVRIQDTDDVVHEVSFSQLRNLPKEEQKPTLIKDIMYELDSGNRTNEQLLGMRMNEFQKLNAPTPNWNNFGTAVMSSATSFGFVQSLGNAAGNSLNSLIANQLGGLNR